MPSSSKKTLRRLLPLTVYPLAEFGFFISAWLALPNSVGLFVVFFLLAAISLSYSIHISFHECVHAGVVFKGPKAIFSAIVSVFAGVPMDGYRAHHLNHHRHNNSVEDYSSTWTHRNGKVMPRKFIIYGFGWPASFLRAKKGLNQDWKEGRLPVSARNRIRFQVLAILVVLLVLAAISWKILLSYVALIYTGWIFTSWHNYLQHPPVSNTDLVTTSYTGQIYNRLFANNGLHWEHHETPGVPWNRIVPNPEAPPTKLSYLYRDQAELSG